MPIRKEPLINECYYHIFNRTYSHEPFLDDQLSRRALLSLWYANYPHRMSISGYLHASKESQQQHVKSIQKYTSKVTLLAFVLMPNHFHLLLKQNADMGISKYVSDFQNTLTQYFNKKHHNLGPLFQRQFKAVQIKTEEQLLHVSRYIHLNPNTAFITHNPEQLENYPYSSLGVYLGKIEDEHKCVNIETILDLYDSSEDYLKFNLDNEDHQKTIHVLSREYLDV